MLYFYMQETENLVMGAKYSRQQYRKIVYFFTASLFVFGSDALLFPLNNGAGEFSVSCFTKFKKS